MLQATNQVITVRFKREDIILVMKVVKGACNMSHIFNSTELHGDYQRAFRMMRDTTMVATGELRSKAFITRSIEGTGAKFVMGYDRTSNNQSELQEFEGGRVHRTEKSHYFNGVYPMCSRYPEDLFKKFGGYTSNPRASRRAMATSIQIAFNTRVRSATRSGSDLYYTPNLSLYVMRRADRTAKLFKTVGLT